MSYTTTLEEVLALRSENAQLREQLEMGREEKERLAEELAEDTRILDSISDAIGLPKDEELSRDNFRSWHARLREQLAGNTAPAREGELALTSAQRN